MPNLIHLRSKMNDDTIKNQIKLLIFKYRYTPKKVRLSC